MVRAVGIWPDLTLFTQGTVKLSTVLVPIPLPKPKDFSQVWSKRKSRAEYRHIVYGPWSQLGHLYL